MKSDLKAAAYWGARQESTKECAERLTGFMTWLSQISSHLHNWHYGTCRVEVEPKSLYELLNDGRNRDETPQRQVIVELGSRVMLWTGKQPDGRSATLIVRCGAYGEYCGVNNVLLSKIPMSWLNVDQAVALVRAMVTSWSPRTAAVCSGPALSAMTNTSIDTPVIDWVFYHRLPRAGELSPPSRVAFHLDGGECIVVQDTPMEPGDPEAEARALALSRQLGLIRGQS